MESSQGFQFMSDVDFSRGIKKSNSPWKKIIQKAANLSTWQVPNSNNCFSLCLLVYEV